MEPPPTPVQPPAPVTPARVTRQSRKRRNSAQDSNSEDLGGSASRMQTDEDEATAGKRMKLRGKRAPDVQLRKSVEKSRKISASSEDDSRKGPPLVVTLDDASQEETHKEEEEKASPASKKIRGRPRGRKRKGGFAKGELCFHTV